MLIISFTFTENHLNSPWHRRRPPSHWVVVVGEAVHPGEEESLKSGLLRISYNIMEYHGIVLSGNDDGHVDVGDDEDPGLAWPVRAAVN